MCPNAVPPKHTARCQKDVPKARGMCLEATFAVPKSKIESRSMRLAVMGELDLGGYRPPGPPSSFSFSLLLFLLRRALSLRPSISPDTRAMWAFEGPTHLSGYPGLLPWVGSPHLLHVHSAKALPSRVVVARRRRRSVREWRNAPLTRVRTPVTTRRSSPGGYTPALGHIWDTLVHPEPSRDLTWMSGIGPKLTFPAVRTWADSPTEAGGTFPTIEKREVWTPPHPWAWQSAPLM